MTVSTIASLAAGLTRSQQNGNAKSLAAITSLIQASSPAKRTNSDAANITSAIALQNQIAQFRVAAQGVAQADAVLSTAASGANEIARALQRLKEIAQRADDPTLSNQERLQLNDEFQAIRTRINATATGTRYNNESLLDGSSQQLKVPGEESLSVGKLTEDALFGSAKLDLTTQQNAKATLEAVQKAITYANAQVKNITTLQDGLDIAASSLQTAIQNQEAANSDFSESDLTSQLLGQTGSDELSIFGDSKSLAAQASRLPSSLLSLLGE